MKYEFPRFKLFAVGNNARNEGNAYQGLNVTPHAVADRFTYLVKRGRRAVLVGYSFKMQCVTAPTATIVAQSLIQHKTIDGNTKNILNIIESFIAPRDVGQSESLIGLPLFPGETITVRTADNNIGGTVNYSLNTYIIEYDDNLCDK